MFTKILAIIVAVSFLFTPVAMAKINMVASCGSLELHKVCNPEGDNCISWLMIRDKMRIVDRAAKNMFAPPTVIGYYYGKDHYYILIQMGFFAMPVGIMHVDEITDGFPHLKVIFDSIDVIEFQTFMEYEDILFYFGYAPENEKQALSLIRMLNNENLKQYDGNGVR